LALQAVPGATDVSTVGARFTVAAGARRRHGRGALGSVCGRVVVMENEREDRIMRRENKGR
jgi:hypothetical protein